MLLSTALTFALWFGGGWLLAQEVSRADDPDSPWQAQLASDRVQPDRSAHHDGFVLLGAIVDCEARQGWADEFVLREVWGDCDTVEDTLARGGLAAGVPLLGRRVPN